MPSARASCSRNASNGRGEASWVFLPSAAGASALGRDDRVLEPAQGIDLEHHVVSRLQPLIVRDLRSVQLEKAARAHGARADHFSRIERHAVACALEDLAESPAHVLDVAVGYLLAVHEALHPQIVALAAWARNRELRELIAGHEP